MLFFTAGTIFCLITADVQRPDFVTSLMRFVIGSLWIIGGLGFITYRIFT